MQENTGIKKYVLTRQAHFGYTKQSYMGGTIITVNYDDGSYSANGSVFKDIRDINIAVRAGFLDAFSETKKKNIEKKIKKQKEFHDKIIENKKEKLPKMEVIKSDQDEIEPIPIETKKKEEPVNNESMEIIKENSDDTARGMTIVRSQPQDVAESSQGTVVATIGDSNVDSSKTAKVSKTAKKKTKESEEKALKMAEKRKADAIKKRNSKKQEEK